jgi:hypothetical protein
MEDMLRACVLTYGKDWEQSLPYAEFSYNNSYKVSLGMSPFEALYGRKCKTPLMWSEVGERALVGPALIKEAEEKVGDPRETESSSIPTKELRRQEKARSKFQPRRFCLSQSLTHPRNAKVSGARKIGPSIHWTISSYEESRSSGIPTGVTRGNVGYTPRVSCLAIKKVFESTRDRIRVDRGNRPATGSAILGDTSQDSRHGH